MSCISATRRRSLARSFLTQWTEMDNSHCLMRSSKDNGVVGVFRSTISDMPPGKGFTMKKRHDDFLQITVKGRQREAFNYSSTCFDFHKKNLFVFDEAFFVKTECVRVIPQISGELMILCHFNNLHIYHLPLYRIKIQLPHFIN